MRLVKEVGNPIDLITFDEVDRSQFLALEHVTFKMEDLTKVRGFAKQLEDNKELYGCAISDNHSTTLKIDLTDVAKENLGIFSGFAPAVLGLDCDLPHSHHQLHRGHFETSHQQEQEKLGHLDGIRLQEQHHHQALSENHGHDSKLVICVKLSDCLVLGYLGSRHS